MSPHETTVARRLEDLFGLDEGAVDDAAVAAVVRIARTVPVDTTGMTRWRERAEDRWKADEPYHATAAALTGLLTGLIDSTERLDHEDRNEQRADDLDEALGRVIAVVDKIRNNPLEGRPGRRHAEMVLAAIDDRPVDPSRFRGESVTVTDAPFGLVVLLHGGGTVTRRETEIGWTSNTTGQPVDLDARDCERVLYDPRWPRG